MGKRKSTTSIWFYIAIIVLLFLVIGFFVSIERRRRIFDLWKKKISEIRDLRRKLAGLYLRKARCDKRAAFVLMACRTLVVVLVLSGAQMIHYYYGSVWYLSIGYSFGLCTMFYKGVVFWFFAGRYGFTDSMKLLENRVQVLVYRANELDPETIQLIEQKIEQLESEAMILKQELRPEAQTR